MKTQEKVFWALLFALLIGLAVSLSVARAEAGPPHSLCAWVEPGYETIHHPATTHVECDQEPVYGDCPIIHVEYTHTVKVWDWWPFWWHYETVVNDYDVQYNKSNDPHKCHRPSSSELENGYGMTQDERKDFNRTYPEFYYLEPIGYIDVNCREVVDEPAWDEQILITEGYWDCPEICEWNQEIAADDPLCVPPDEPCVWQQYWLRDTKGHMCYIIRNFSEGYSAGNLPAPYTDKVYRNEFCSKDCQGNPVPWNGQLDEWGTTCGMCDEGCR